jgi:hypothetical protein
MAMIYRNHRYIDSPSIDLMQPCSYDCRMIMYCQTISSDYDEWQYCQDHDKFDPFDLDSALQSFSWIVSPAWFDKR